MLAFLFLISSALGPARLQASRIEAKLFCSALLTTTLRRTPVPSLKAEEARKAIYALAGFARTKLPPSETGSANESAVMITSEDRSPRRRRKAAERIRTVLEAYTAHHGTDFVAAVLYGDAACKTFLDEVTRAEGGLQDRFMPKCLPLTGDADASAIQDFFCGDGPGAEQGRAGRWLFTSERLRLRPWLVRVLLHYRHLDSELVEHELKVEVDVAEDSAFDRFRRLSKAYRAGQSVRTTHSYLYDTRDVWIERLAEVRPDGERVLTILLRIANQPPGARSLMRPARRTTPARIGLAAGV